MEGAGSAREIPAPRKETALTEYTLVCAIAEILPSAHSNADRSIFRVLIKQIRFRVVSFSMSLFDLPKSLSGNIAPKLRAVEFYFAHRQISPLARLRQGAAQSCHAQDASAGGDDVIALERG